MIQPARFAQHDAVCTHGGGSSGFWQSGLVCHTKRTCGCLPPVSARAPSLRVAWHYAFEGSRELLQLATAAGPACRLLRCSVDVDYQVRQGSRRGADRLGLGTPDAAGVGAGVGGGGDGRPLDPRRTMSAAQSQAAGKEDKRPDFPMARPSAGEPPKEVGRWVGRARGRYSCSLATFRLHLHPPLQYAILRNKCPLSQAKLWDGGWAGWGAVPGRACERASSNTILSLPTPPPRLLHLAGHQAPAPDAGAGQGGGRARQGLRAQAATLCLHLSHPGAGAGRHQLQQGQDPRGERQLGRKEETAAGGGMPGHSLLLQLLTPLPPSAASHPHPPLWCRTSRS